MLRFVSVFHRRVPGHRRRRDWRRRGSEAWLVPTALADRPCATTFSEVDAFHADAPLETGHPDPASSREAASAHDSVIDALIDRRGERHRRQARRGRWPVRIHAGPVGPRSAHRGSAARDPGRGGRRAAERRSCPRSRRAPGGAPPFSRASRRCGPDREGRYYTAANLTLLVGSFGRC